MIWFLLRAFTGDFLPGGGILTVLMGSVLACCAVFGIYKCSHFRMRDCSCIKWCMRASGTDTFDDFEVMMVVHEAIFTANQAKLTTAVRITAGAHRVQTDASNKGIFQQPLALFVEQGTETVEVELLDSRSRKVLAVTKLDTIKDILKSKTINTETVHNMKVKNKGVLNPKVKLTIHLETEHDVEKNLLSGVAISTEADLMLRQQLSKAPRDHRDDIEEGTPHAQASDLDLVATGCCGPLDMFGSWGTRETVYVAVRGPPDLRKYMLCIYKDEHEYQRGQKPKEEVDLLKVLSVQPDPGRSDVLMIHYVQSEKVKKKLTFRRIDRTRDVWVEMLTLMIKLIREQKEKKREHRDHRGSIGSFT